MVSGGFNGGAILDTTEIYQDKEWRTVVGKLPVPLYYGRAATISNKIYITGIT